MILVTRNRAHSRSSLLHARRQLGPNSLCRVGLVDIPTPSLAWLTMLHLLLYHSGYTDVPAGTISPTSVSVSFIPPVQSSNPTPLRLLKNGEPEPEIDEKRASEILAEEDLEILVDLGVAGGEKAKYWTCDFSHVS